MTKLTPELLRRLSPIDGLKRENLHALMKKTSIKSAAQGRALFKERDTAKITFYLIKGRVELRVEGKVIRIVEGGTDTTKHPLAPVIPRRVEARAATAIEYIAIETDVLDMMLTWDSTGAYEVGELKTNEDQAGDWMTVLLQTKAFHKIPPANIQAIFMKMEQVSYPEGTTVIKQGDPGDYFYAITDGRVAVKRETPLNKEGIKLAELKVGDTFGEEALISGGKRNATVTMLTNGTLMRLAKEDFAKLLNEPMIQWVQVDEAEKLVSQGAQWLDVRLPSEYEGFHFDQAINIPLYFIRLKIKTLDINTQYIVYCDTGRRSSAAAYILAERGFDVRVLKEGLAKQQDTVRTKINKVINESALPKR